MFEFHKRKGFGIFRLSMVRSSPNFDTSDCLLGDLYRNRRCHRRYRLTQWQRPRARHREYIPNIKCPRPLLPRHSPLGPSMNPAWSYTTPIGGSVFMSLSSSEMGGSHIGIHSLGISKSVVTHHFESCAGRIMDLCSDIYNWHCEERE